MSKETAEQKLLKLIEASSPGATVVQPSGQEVASQMAQAVRGQSPAASMPGFLRSILGFGKSGSSAFAFGLREINHVLLGIIAVIFVFLGIDFLNGMKSLQKKIDLAVDNNRAKTSSNIILAAKSLEDYLSPIENRNIFQPFEKKAVEEKSDVPQENKKISAMAEKLKLVGVSWFDSAETASVMIEDKDKGTTYYVRQGEKVNDLTVKTIYTDRVVLTYEDEEITIKL